MRMQKIIAGVFYKNRQFLKAEAEVLMLIYRQLKQGK